jgi:hypothetical protein
MNSENMVAVEWHGLGPLDPMNPTNKLGYYKLPENAPCRNCIHFSGLKWINDVSMRLFCESQWEKVSTLIRFDPDQLNGGSVSDGECFKELNGYSDAGIMFGA